MVPNTFKGNFCGADNKDVRVCGNHGGHTPPVGKIPCEWKSDSGFWFPVYVSVDSVPAHLRRDK